MFEIFLWQVEPMSDDPLYSKLNVENDYQFAVDRKQVDAFVQNLSSLNEGQIATFSCKLLASGQPHSCDNQDETWGIHSKSFTNLTIQKSIAAQSFVRTREGHVFLDLNNYMLNAFIGNLLDASRTRVFFEYEYYITLHTNTGENSRIVFWGWCEKGKIEYAS
jgi:hypothetical protein